MSRAGFRCALWRSLGGVLGVARIEAREMIEQRPEILPGGVPGCKQDIVHPGGPRSAAAGTSRGARAVGILRRAGRVLVLVRAET